MKVSIFLIFLILSFLQLWILSQANDINFITGQSNATTSHNNFSTTASPDSESCSTHTSCSECVKSTSCVWCGATDTSDSSYVNSSCQAGFWWGPQNKDQCSSWR